MYIQILASTKLLQSNESAAKKAIINFCLGNYSIISALWWAQPPSTNYIFATKWAAPLTCVWAGRAIKKYLNGPVTFSRSGIFKCFCYPHDLPMNIMK